MLDRIIPRVRAEKEKRARGERSSRKVLNVLRAARPAGPLSLSARSWSLSRRVRSFDQEAGRE